MAAAAPPPPALQTDAAVVDIDEADNTAAVPVDYGYGPGVARPGKRLARAIAAAQAMKPFSVPVGSTSAGTVGFYGRAVPWPVIPISATLMPDGRVMSFGTDGQGNQGAQLIYDVWDPTRGLDLGAHLVLPNVTETDIFCGGASLLTGTGQVLLVGGDLTIGGKRNFSNNLAEIFNPTTNTISAAAPMQYARWYPSVISMPSGERVVLGGRISPTAAAITPEVYNPTNGWRALDGASSDTAFNFRSLGWYYPRGYVTRLGQVFILGPDGAMWSLNPTGSGSLTRYRNMAPPGLRWLPVVMYTPGTILALRANATSVTIGINGVAPVATDAGMVSQDRIWANGTVLADGTVVVTGGSAVVNALTGIAYQNETWDPATRQWTRGAVATKPRLYHSIALLLPDGSVLTAGGGAPGPLRNLNAEIYYPPYLYLKDGSGQPAPRPSIVTSPSEVVLGSAFQATVGATDRIVRVAMMRLGSVTHSNNADQSHHQVPFRQTGAALTVTLPTDKGIMPPGHYMMFAFNRAGVPSIASIMRVSTP